MGIFRNIVVARWRAFSVLKYPLLSWSTICCLEVPFSSRSTLGRMKYPKYHARYPKAAYWYPIGTLISKCVCPCSCISPCPCPYICYARNPDVRDLKIALRLLRMTCLGSHLKMVAQTPDSGQWASLITETCNWLVDCADTSCNNGRSCTV